MNFKIENFDLASAIRKIENTSFKDWLLAELFEAYLEARKGKRKTNDEHIFELNQFENLNNLADSIIEENYKPSPSISFIVFDPMVREIFAAPFRDRVVHHFLYNLQAGWWDNRFIYDSYSCRIEKGTLFGIKRIQKMMRRASKNGQEKAYVIKLDISGYFMSLPRKKLYENVVWGLDQQFKKYKSSLTGRQIYRICKYLWRETLFDDPVKTARRRGPKYYWNENILPPKKSLFAQPKGRGIVIGNLTSQLVSNIYLDQLDRFIKYNLKIKYYGRYVDDLVIIVSEKDYEKTKKDITKIEEFLKTELKLTLHPKKRYFQPVNHGVETLGARIYPYRLYPSDRLQKKFYRAAEDFSYGKKKLDTIISYLGLTKHLDAEKYLEKLFDDFGWRRRK